MTEDFNREEAKKIIEDISKSYYEANGKFIIKGNTEIVGASDSQLWGRSSVPYLIEAVEKALYSGMSAGEIEDAVLNASDNIPFQPKGGDVAKKGDLAQNNIARHLARSIPSKGKSDKELNLEYTKFKKDFIPEDWDDFDNKLKKDGVPTAQRQRILTHLKNNWSGDDGIKQTVLDVAKSKLVDGTSANSMELLAELAPYKGTGTPTLKNLSMFLVMPEMSDEEMLDSMMNFSSASSAKQAELKAAGPSAATETAEGGETGPSQAGAEGFDQFKPRTVYEQDKDGNWITGEKTGYGDFEQWVSKPTIVDGVEPDNTRLNEYYAKVEKENQEKKAIALERSIYDRTRGDATADYDRDLAQDKTYYDRDLAQEAAYYKRDLDQEEEDYARDIAREDAKQRELNARYDIQRNQDMKRADLIMLGQWTRDDEVAYRNREWDIDDRRDDRLWEEAQQAEDRTFRTGQLAMQMGPQYFQSQLDAAEFEKDVLSNASDYIAAAFMQRGEASPFKAVTQADLINGFRAKARDMMQATEAGFRPDIGDPAEFAKGVVQAAGQASGGAAASVGAALGGTYNPNPGGAPPAGTNTGPNTGPKTGPNTGTGPPKGPPAGPAAGSNTSASDENPVVNQRDNGDGTITVFFLDGTSLDIGTPTLDPRANAFAQNPNLQDDINQLQARLDGTFRPSTEQGQRVISPEEAAASASLIDGNMPGGLGFTPPPFADPSTMTGMWAGGTAGDAQVRPPENFETQFNFELPFQAPNVSNNNINVAQNTGTEYPVDNFFSESFGEMMQPQLQPQAPVITSSPDDFFSESFTDVMPSQGFVPPTSGGYTPITSDQVDISGDGILGNVFGDYTGVPPIPPQSVGFNVNEKVMPPSPDMSWMYGMPNIPSFNIPMPSNPDFGMDPFQYPDDPNPAPASTTPKSIYGMPSMPSFNLPIPDSITGGPSNTDRTRARRDAIQQAKAGRRGSLG